MVCEVCCTLASYKHDYYVHCTPLCYLRNSQAESLRSEKEMAEQKIAKMRMVQKVRKRETDGQ